MNNVFIEVKGGELLPCGINLFTISKNGGIQMILFFS